MSGTGTGRRASEGFAGVVEALRKSPRSPRLFTKAQAARRLGVTRATLELMVALDVLDVVQEGRRELVFL